MLAMEGQGGGRDARFSLGYSILTGESSPDIYSGHGRTSSSMNAAISRSPMLPSSCNVAMTRGIKRTSSDVCFDQEVTGGRPMTSQPLSINTDISSELVDDGYTQVQQNKKTPPPNGKKTKGRVKIKMEYIDNKLRRYTTFSKRKTGIMKKAYELSTLTGTQVMLLVASETGHVYTFATRKLQPMITSEAGKALIQTCLNSPDPAPSSVGGDQRMSATGFEETELTYNISDEEQKDDGMSSHSEDENSVGDGDSYGSGGDSPVVIESEEMKAGVNGEGSASSTSQPVVSAGLVSPGSRPGVVYQTSNGMVYAAPSSALPNGFIFSLSPQIDPGGCGGGGGGGDGGGGGGSSSNRSQSTFRQQLITIPFPMLSTNPGGNCSGGTTGNKGDRDEQEAADLSKSRK